MIILCFNKPTKTNKTVLDIQPLGEDVKLVISDRKDILWATMVLSFSAHSKLPEAAIERIHDMLNKQYPSMRINDLNDSMRSQGPLNSG